MNKITLAYIAGVMDSDGYFTIKRSSYNIRKLKNSKNCTYSERVGLKQIQPQAVELIHQLFGGYKNIQKPNTKNGKPLHGIQLMNQKAHKFIKAIYPYLRIKKAQAEILLELRKSLKKPKDFKQVSYHKSRWGKNVAFTRYAVSEETITLREFLRDKIRSLNDCRNDPTHQPIPWK